MPLSPIADDPPRTRSASRVLLVIPDAGTRRTAEDALRDHATVVALGDASRALASAFEAAPDAIVVDVEAGTDIVRTLRADPRTRGVPILMMTERLRDGGLDGLDADADEYLVKPLSAADLRARVESHARRAW